MAITSTKKSSMLSKTFVLAPERYDPRRELQANDNVVSLGDIVSCVRKVIQPAKAKGDYLVLDTSDASEGIIVGRKTVTTEIGSSKKCLETNDVIISRLRPYLRQVAYIDDAIPHAQGSQLVCSTEFFVLRSADESSIAFLVPFLLSAPVQEVLAASQEGGHHPRFDESTLLNLPVPNTLIRTRKAVSNQIIDAIKQYRECESTICKLVQKADSSFEA